MMKMTSLILVLVLASSTWAHAGGGSGAGNGGHGVVCRAPDKSIISVEALDLFEARTFHRWNLSLGGANLDYHQKEEIALKRLARLSPKRAALYRTWLKDFEKEALFLNGVDLTFIPDSGSLAVPTGCGLEQIVIQKTPVLPNDPRYTINGDLWNHMTSDQKAAMALHEVTYREMLTFGHIYSTAARYLVGLATSDFIDSLTMASFLETLQDLAVPTIDFDGIDIRIIKCADEVCRTSQDVTQKEVFNFYPSGNLKSYAPHPGWEENCGSYEFPVAAHVVQVLEGLCDGDFAGWNFSDQSPPVVSSVFSDKIRLIGAFGNVVGTPAALSYEISPEGNMEKIKGGFGTTAKLLTFTPEQTLYFSDDGELLEIDQAKNDTAGGLNISATRLEFYPGLLPKRAEGNISVTGLSKNGQALPEVVSIGPEAPLYPNSSIEWDQEGNWSASGLGHRLKNDHLNCSTKLNSVETIIGGLLQKDKESPISLIPIADTELCDIFGTHYAVVQGGERLDLDPYYSVPLSLVLSSDTTLDIFYFKGDSGYLQSVPFKAGERIDYYPLREGPDKVVKTGVVSSDAELKTGWFSKTVQAGTRVQFDSQGYLIDP